jgi:ankyrin repeat protein
MHMAAALDRPDAIELLLELGVSPDVPDENWGGQTPLHGAAWGDAPAAAALLIARGARIDVVEREHGSTPFGFALYGRRARMIELLGRHTRHIWDLVFVGNVERVRELLREEPAMARSVNREGETLLMWLPDDEERALEMVELLLEHGADPTIADKKRQTALSHAKSRALERVARLLQGRAPHGGGEVGRG